MRALFPTRALALLLAIGLADLAATASLHARGLVEERNPLMARFLERGEVGFVAVKAATLIAAWALLARHARADPLWVRRACLGGSAAYIALLVAAFYGGLG